MEENPSSLMSKEAFLEGIRKILKSNKEAVEIMRETPLSNFKVVKRNSKTIKDPNPLASTMRALSHKYPLIADREKTEFYGAPEDLYNKGREDKHHHGKVNCRLEFIDWWITSSTAVDEDTKKTVDIINQVRKAELDSWKKVSFQKANITIAQSIMPREPVVVQKALIDIPRTQVNQALKQALGIPNHTKLIQFTGDVEKKLEGLRVKKVPNQLSLMTQLPLVQKDMQKKVTYLPMSSRVPAELACHRYMFNGTFYATANYELSDHQVQQISNRVLNNICKILAILIQEKDMEKARIEILKCKLGIHTIPELLEILTVKECYETKIVRACLGLPVNLDTEERGVEFAPCISNKLIPHVKRVNNVPYTIYIGAETVMFRFGEIRGALDKSGDIMSGIRMTRGSDADMSHVIGAIKLYTRSGWGSLKGRTYQELKNESFKIGKTEPWSVLDCEESDYRAMLMGESNSAGILEIKEDMEFMRSAKMQMRVKALDLYSEDGTRCLIRKPPGLSKNIDVLPPDFSCPLEPLLFKYKPALSRLSSTICFMASNLKTVKTNIKNEKWNWENQHIWDLISPEDQNSVAGTARALAYGYYKKGYEDCSAVRLGFIYSFCFGHFKIPRLDIKLSFSYSNIYKIDLTLTNPEATVKYNAERKVFLVGREKIALRESDTSEIPEIRYDDHWAVGVPKTTDEDYPLRTLDLFQQDPSKFAHDTKFFMYINGVKVVIRRNSNLKRAIKRTVEDRIEEVFRLQTLLARAAHIKKRKLDDEEGKPSTSAE